MSSDDWGPPHRNPTKIPQFFVFGDFRPVGSKNMSLDDWGPPRKNPAKIPRPAKIPQFFVFDDFRPVGSKNMSLDDWGDHPVKIPRKSQGPRKSRNFLFLTIFGRWGQKTCPWMTGGDPVKIPHFFPQFFFSTIFGRWDQKTCPWMTGGHPVKIPHFSRIFGGGSVFFFKKKFFLNSDLENLTFFLGPRYLTRKSGVFSDFFL